MANRKHNKSVHIWDMQHGKLIKQLPGPAGPESIENEAASLTFSPDNRFIAVGYVTQRQGDSVHLFDVETGERIRVMHPSYSTHNPFVFFDAGRYLGFESDGFHIIEVATGKQVQEFKLKASYALSPDGRYLAVGMQEEKHLKIMERKTVQNVNILGSIKGYYRLLALSGRPVSGRVNPKVIIAIMQLRADPRTIESPPAREASLISSGGLGSGFLTLAIYILAVGAAGAFHWDRFIGCAGAVFVLAAIGGDLLFGRRTR